MYIINNALVLSETCAHCHPGVNSKEIEKGVEEYVKHCPNHKGGSNYEKKKKVGFAGYFFVVLLQKCILVY